MKNKRVIKLRKKLRKFYERELKVRWIKIPKCLLNDVPTLANILTDLDPKNHERFKGAIRNVSKVEYGEDGRDFLNDTVSARLTYTYPKYGNL